MLPRQKVRETRAALVDHFSQERFVHPSALFAPDRQDIVDLIKHGEAADDQEEADIDTDADADTDTAALGEKGTDPFEAEDDLHTFDKESEAGEPDEDQDAYGIAAE